jgi:hypothetical protein
MYFDIDIDSDRANEVHEAADDRPVRVSVIIILILEGTRVLIPGIAQVGDVCRREVSSPLSGGNNFRENVLNSPRSSCLGVRRGGGALLANKGVVCWHPPQMFQVRMHHVSTEHVQIEVILVIACMDRENVGQSENRTTYRKVVRSPPLQRRSPSR